MEKLVKSRKRVRQHGEVFTPVKVVNDMLNMNGMKEQVENLRTRVLEPAVGEGVFLQEILKRRLNHLLGIEQKDQEVSQEQYQIQNITQYENLSLLTLSTLYGIELLEDNTKKCVQNLFECFSEYYQTALGVYEKKPKKKVLQSAMTIICANIVQGNFLKQTNALGNPLVFSHWKELPNKRSKNKLVVIRTEYSLEEIKKRLRKEDGTLINQGQDANPEDFKTLASAAKTKTYRYVKCNISEVYKEEKEEY